jgi:hypothetical protein
LLIEAFRAAYGKTRDIRLVICGKGTLESHPGIITLGFCERIHDWIASVDCVVNANRKSYFDLSALETLSVGTSLAITPTQGYKVLLEHKSRGIFPILPNTSALEQFFCRH